MPTQSPDQKQMETPITLDWEPAPPNVQLSATEVHVWSARLDISDEYTARHWTNLDADERVRAEKFIFSRDRSRFVVARGVLRHILARYLRTTASEVRFSYGEFGKPAVDQRFEIRFNLAHSNGLVLYAFSRSRDIGVDLESLQNVAEVPESSFSDPERIALEALSRDLRRSARVILWTRKEAYLKALGCGLQEDPASFDISVPPAAPALLRPLNHDERHDRWHFSDVHPAAGFCGTLCVDGKVEVRQWSWSDAAEI